MQTQTVRIPGDFGTVEEGYKYQAGKRYNRASKPSAKPSGTSITGSVPTQAQREKRKSIEAQHARNEPTPKKPRGGKPRYVRFIGRTREDLYGIEVKITGIAADTYWLPYSQASKLWAEMSGTNLQSYV